MQIKAFEESALLEAARKAFPHHHIQITQSDIFLKGKQAGRYRADWLDHEFYVSTEYAYEDRLVNGNKTRYKVSMPCIFVKNDPFEVLYDIQTCYYAVYEENGEIQFMLYTEMNQELVQHMELLEALTPV